MQKPSDCEGPRARLPDDLENAIVRSISLPKRKIYLPMFFLVSTIMNELRQLVKKSVPRPLEIPPAIPPRECVLPLYGLGVFFCLYRSIMSCQSV